jgi:pyruvate kinase
VLDGADAVMLMQESHSGNYPLQAVTTMSKCCVEAERCFDSKRHYNDMKSFTQPPLPTQEAIASAAVQTVLDLGIDLIICLTETGHMARLLAKYRPPVTILACSSSPAVIKQLSVTRGVVALKIPSY